MNKEFFKKILPYLAALAIFIILTLIYASPVLDGKVINAGDPKGWQGMRHETKSTMMMVSTAGGRAPCSVGCRPIKQVAAPIQHLPSMLISGRLAPYTSPTR